MTVVGGDGCILHRSLLGGHGAPDLAVVDTVARRALWATRAGGRLVLTEVAPGLRELLVLAALSGVADGAGAGDHLLADGDHPLADGDHPLADGDGPAAGGDGA